ncbi:MAG: ribonuclease P protein component [Candidatus Pacebacteria bacterium]|nr:ribonuclease P protein component [Candidatus Paceibacterota bacterium]
MLKKQFRIRKQKDFENVFSKGRYISEKFLTLKIVSNKLAFSRFGFIISNKVSKKAVERNRAKRLLRESIRLFQDSIKSQIDFVFIPKKEIIGKDFVEVNECVEKLLKRSGLLEK